MKYVILTNGNDFCTKTLQFLEGKSGIAELIILVEVPYLLKDYKRKSDKPGIILFIKLFYRLTARLLFVTEFLLRNVKHWEKVDFVGHISSEKTLSRIEKYNIDVVFLAGMSILSPLFLSKISIGVYNCHPGLVPNVRGVDVIYHAVVNSIPPIISIHRVDEGIDTGSMIQGFQVPAELLKMDGLYEEICEEVLIYGAKKFADFILDYLLKGQEVVHIECSRDFPILGYCRKVTDKNYSLFTKEIRNIYQVD